MTYLERSVADGHAKFSSEGILANCVDHLEGISLDRTELDIKGVAFEEFMGGFFKDDFGQYFTTSSEIYCAYGPRNRSPLRWMRWSGDSAIHTSVSQAMSQAKRRYVLQSRNAVTKTTPTVHGWSNS